MADPFSFAAGALTFTEASFKLGKLTKRVLELRNADQAVQEVREGVEAARQLLRHVRLALGAANGDKLPQDAPTAYTAILTPIEKKLAKIDDILAKISKPRSSLGGDKVVKFQWLKKRSVVEGLLQRLQMDLLQLGPMTASVVLSTSTHIQSEVDRLAQPSEKKIPRTTQATHHPSQTETSQSQHQHLSQNRSTISGTQQALQYPRDSPIIYPVSTESILYFLGALCMAWGGSSPHCTRKNCPKCLQHTTTLLFRVFLPSWLLAKVLIGSITYAQSRGLSFHLRFPSVRPSSAEIFEFVSLGNIAGIQHAFKAGTASVWDVDPDGNGLLWYALTAFNEHMTPTCRLLLSCGIDLLSADSNPSGRLYATSIHVWRLIARQRVATEKATSLNMLSKSWLANSPVRDIMTRLDSPDVELPWVLKRKWEGAEQPLLYAEPGYYHGDFFFARASGNGYVTEAVLHNNERALRRLLQIADSASSCPSSHADGEVGKEKGSSDVVQLLSSPSLDLELANSYGLTALHYAILYNRTQCLPLLLRAGANCAAVSQHSYNILHFAAIAATTQTLDLLASAPVLRNAEQVPVPRVDLPYIKAVRQRVGAMREKCLGDEEWWRAWERVLERFGDGDGGRVDEMWDEGLPFPGPAVRRVFC